MFGSKKIGLTQEEYREFVEALQRIQELERMYKGLREAINSLRDELNRKSPTSGGYANSLADKVEAEIDFPQFIEEMRRKLADAVQSRFDEYLRGNFKESEMERLVDDICEELDFEEVARVLAPDLKEEIDTEVLIKELARVANEDLDTDDLAQRVGEAIADRVQIHLEKR